MPEITIESDDVEALLFAAGAAASASASSGLQQKLRENSQFDQVADRLPEVIRRVGDHWRDASRREHFPERFQPPTPRDIARLRDLDRRGARGMFGAFELMLGPANRDLVRNGFIELGVYTEECVWANAGPQRFQHADRRVRLTARGEQVIIDADERERIAREDLAFEVAKGMIADQP